VQTYSHIHPPVWLLDTSALKSGNYILHFKQQDNLLQSLKFIVL